MVQDPNYSMREQLREQVRPEFERMRIRWLLDQEFKNAPPDAHKAISLMDEALRLMHSPGGARQACALAAEAYKNADQDRNIRYSAIQIFNTYARQLLDAGMPADALDSCLFMEDLGLVDGITYRNFAVAYHNLGYPNEAITRIERAIREMPDQVWFHIVAAECYILKALQQGTIYNSRWEAQKFLYQAAEQIGRAYSRGDEEIKQHASFFLSVIIATRLANDWTHLFGGMGQIGKSLNLDHPSLREIRQLSATPQDAKNEVDRLARLLRAARPYQKALPEVYEQVMRGGSPSIQAPAPTYALSSPPIDFSCPNCRRTGQAPRPMRLECQSCKHIFFVDK